MNEHTLAMDWGRLAYRCCRGEGTPLVFLHGTGCDSADWAQTLAGLPPEAHWLALDFRGHGESSTPSGPFTIEDLADDVLALLGALALRRAWLVGHSLGGMVALEASWRCRAGCYRAASGVVPGAPLIGGLVLLEGWTRLAAVQAAFDDRRFYGALPAEAAAQIQAKARTTRERFAPADWAHFWASVQRFDARPYLAQMALPIYEVYGSMGAHSEAKGRLEVPDRPNIQFAWIEGAGHYLPHERPMDVAAVCREVMGPSARGGR